MSAYGCNPLSSPTAQATAAQAANTAAMYQAYIPQWDTAYGQIAARVLAWITEALQAQVDAQSAIGSKLAVPLAAGLAQQESAMAAVQGAVTASIQAGLAQPGPVHPQSTSPTATVPNFTEGWNLWSVRTEDGWTKPIPEQYWTTYRDGCQYMFRGWALQYGDAQALAATLPALGKDVRSECFPVVTPVISGPCPPGVTTYRVWELLGGAAPQCAILCSTADAPGPGWVPYGTETDLAGAQALVQTLCGSPVVVITPPTTGGTVYYGGCLSGKPTTWDSTQAVPAGVTNVVGPFPDAATALAKVGACPPIITPPTVGTGQCCGIDPNTGALILPSCITIDLCRWDEFCREMSLAVRQALNAVLCDPTCFVQPLCDCLEKSLCKVFSNKECTAGYQDAERYIFEDQDNTFTPDIQSWVGNLGGNMYGAGSLDDMAALPFGG